MAYKSITLRGNKITIIDIDDYENVTKYKWHYYRSGKNEYAKCSYMGKDCSIPLARFIMGLKRGDGLVVDHINHNGLDNRKSNLRVCTNTENQRNRLGNSKKSKYKGINKKVRGNYIAYEAQIGHRGKNIYLGSYKTDKEAALAYNSKAKELFGDYALLNKVATADDNHTKRIRND